MDEERKSVDAIMRKIIAEIEPIKTLGSGKAILAGIRDSIGKELTNAPQVWPMLFANLPEEYLGNKSRVTAEENAIYLSLQIYALMQQGSSKLPAVTMVLKRSSIAFVLLSSPRRSRKLSPIFRVAFSSPLSCFEEPCCITA